MRILILGSSRHLEEGQRAAFAAACEAIGMAAARGKDSLILCSQSSHTADPYCLKGAKPSRGAVKATLFQPSSPNDESESHSRGAIDAALWNNVPVTVCEGGWRTLHLHAIREADVVMAIGGSTRGTQNTIFSAELLSRPVVLIPTFGGAASDCFGYFRGRYYLDSEANALRQSWGADPKDIALSIVEVARQFSKRYVRSLQTSRERFLLTALTLTFLALWMYIMFGSPPIIGAPAALCILLASASVSGSLLRLIARSLGALPSEWAEGRPVSSITFGLLMGFGLLLLGGFTNFALNGKIMTIDSYDDARRIGFSLSSIMFLVALFLEQAWARFAEKGLAQLKKS